jgi:uncharacterized protein
MDGVRDVIELASHDSRFDLARVYVIGHSQGGNLAPRIAKENPGVAGVVMLAAPTGPLQESLLDQFAYLASLSPDPHALDQEIEKTRAFKTAVEDPGLGPDDDVALSTGGNLKGAYFLESRDYRPTEVMASLPTRALVLQGERDYQVTMRDFAGWRKALQDKANATLKSYPNLNHLFVAGSGTSTPAEYQAPNHVDGGVVSDIVGWIRGS